MIPSARPYIKVEDVLPDIQTILASGRLVLGEYTQRLEQEYVRWTKMEHAVAVASCSAALQIALRYYRVHGQKVLVPANSFVANVATVVAEGGIPVFYEMSPDTYCADVDALLQSIADNKPAAVVLVHIAGYVEPRLEEIFQHFHIPVIEDMAHAHAGVRPASRESALCYSFYPTKVVTGGTGGLLATRDSDLARFARCVRHHGAGDSLESIAQLGSDWLLPEINACLVLQGLSGLGIAAFDRNGVADLYRKLVCGAGGFIFPKWGGRRVWGPYKLPLTVPEGVDRDRMRGWLAYRGVETGVLYDPLVYLQPAVMRALGTRRGLCPKAEAAIKQQLCPPLYPQLTRAEVERIATLMLEFLHGAQ